MYQLAHDKPAEFLAYVTERGITTWTGEVIGKVTTAYPWRRCGTPTGGTYKRRNLRIRTDWGYNYIATETDNKQIVRLRRVAD
ncbi:hypothetical protein [Tepidimonas sp.]|uniref:hypothetical protein n=1 Tax=Tepidimonas sp. TaxID=2002775 RepID=UPI00391A982A